MKQVDTFRHKKVLVLGLAKSGVAAATLLHKLDAFVTVNDFKPLEDNTDAQHLLEAGITVICGSHPLELLDDGFEFLVKNPGIPYSNPMVQRAKELNIPILTEVELAYLVSEAPIIGITGSNGKTTTTTLILEMLNNNAPRALVAGNIGKVASVVTPKASKDQVIVMELSSFQLMGIQKFTPKIAVLMNIFDAHLDYHSSKEEYVWAKSQITANQTSEDYFIYNEDSELIKEIAKNSKANTIPFSVSKQLTNGAYILNQAIYFKDEWIIDIKDIVLPGIHNLENILAAIIVAKLQGVSNEAIVHVLTTFKGVEHRLQYIGMKNGRKFYNDSKATNILATQKALSAFTTPVILIAGGLDRNNSFDELIPYLKNVKTLVVYGQTKEKLKDAGIKANVKTIIEVDHLTLAVKKAYEHSSVDDCILLSPACASWDQFKTFEERGNIFVHAVHMLK